MHRHTFAPRALAAAAGITALSMTGITGAGASGAAAAGPSAAAAVISPATAGPGAPLWVQRYNGPANGFDGAFSIAVSPHGGKVFVTGDSMGTTSGSDFATIAYDAATGAQLWDSRYNGPANSDDYAATLAVSPRGDEVFVAGRSRNAASGTDYATVAYRASTGAQLWVSRYNGPANGFDGASSVAVSPSGRTVYVTGESRGRTSGADYATIAYNAATGARLWVSRYNAPANRADRATRVAVSPAGGKIFVTGESQGRTSSSDYATVAYNAATGARLWVSRYNGPGNKVDRPGSLAVGPGGGTVFVTGESLGKTSSSDYATVAYRAATGARLWVSRYNGPANSADAASSLAVSPGGRTVVVTGTSNVVGIDLFDARPARAVFPLPDYATVAYRAATGKTLWVRRYRGPGDGMDFAYAVAFGPGGARVFVTGFSLVAKTAADFLTIAYSAGAGGQLRVWRYNGPSNGNDAATALAVSPAGRRIFVTGISRWPGTGPDYATVAYRT